MNDNIIYFNEWFDNYWQIHNKPQINFNIFLTAMKIENNGWSSEIIHKFPYKNPNNGYIRIFLNRIGRREEEIPYIEIICSAFKFDQVKNRFFLGSNLYTLDNDWVDFVQENSEKIIYFSKYPIIDYNHMIPLKNSKNNINLKRRKLW